MAVGPGPLNSTLDHPVLVVCQFASWKPNHMFLNVGCSLLEYLHGGSTVALCGRGHAVR